jgi:hypothetical protein
MKEGSGKMTYKRKRRRKRCDEMKKEGSRTNLLKVISKDLLSSLKIIFMIRKFN